MRRYVAMTLAFALGVALASGGVRLLDDEVADDIDYVNASWAYDLSDPELVADKVDAIFVGTVTARAGQVSDEPTIPTSLWEVEAEETLMGDVPSTVTVAERGGFVDDRLVLIEGAPLLTVGATYIVPATHSDVDGWYTRIPSPAAGRVPHSLSNDSAMRQRWLEAIDS